VWWEGERQLPPRNVTFSTTGHVKDFPHVLLLQEISLIRQMYIDNLISNTLIHTYFLPTLFTIYGIQETIVSDNGTLLVNTLMKQFLKANGVRHITAAPYHPSSYGLAEQVIQTCNCKAAKYQVVPWKLKSNVFA